MNICGFKNFQRILKANMEYNLDDDVIIQFANIKCTYMKVTADHSQGVSESLVLLHQFHTMLFLSRLAIY